MPNLRISIPQSHQQKTDHLRDRSQDRGRLPIVHISPSSADHDCYEGCNCVALQLTFPPHYTTDHGEVKLPSPGLGCGFGGEDVLPEEMPGFHSFPIRQPDTNGL
jgi:hypothetical protein